MLDNLYQKTPKTSKVKSGFMDKRIRSALELIGVSDRSDIRTRTMERIEEDRLLIKELFSLIPALDNPRQIKGTALLQLLRMYSEHTRLPNSVIEGQKGRKDDLTASVATAVRDDSFERGNVKDAHAENYMAKLSDGNAYMKLEQEDDRTMYKNVVVSDLFFDPLATSLSKTEWVAQKTSYQYAKAVQVLEDWTGHKWKNKISVGSPLESLDVSMETKDEPETERTDAKDGLVTIFRFWSKTKKKMITFAGGDATFIKEVDFKDDFPFVEFYFSDIKDGAYSMSMVTSIKDVVELYVKTLNKMFTMLKMKADPIVLVNSDEGASMTDKMQRAKLESQYYNIPAFIETESRETQMRVITPDYDPAGAIKILEYCISEIEKRTGISISNLDPLRETATATVTKRDVTNQALANIFRVNIEGYKRLSEKALEFAKKSYKKSDGRRLTVEAPKFNVTEDTLSEFETQPVSISHIELLHLLRNYEGNVVVDATIAPKMDATEKVQVLAEFKANLMNVLSNKQLLQSPDEVQILKKIDQATVNLRQLTDYIKSEDLSNFYDSQVKQNEEQKQQQQQAEQQVQQQQGGLPQPQGLPPEALAPV